MESTTPTSRKVLLGKYGLGRLLGSGTFAKVYYARSLADDSCVAIKAIDKAKITSPAMEELIIREVSAMRRLSHPNIIKLHEVMATKSKIYLVMEHAKGGELFVRVLHHGRLKESTARRYFQQLVSALHLCHSHGIAHRDLKLENLLLDQDGNLKVSDFGLSALPEQLKDGLLHTACGTPAYTAPEVMRRKGYDGTKADAWSCGIILYVLLAGFLPFEDANIVTLYRRIQRREFHFPPWFSRPAQWVISRLLDPNPETRITIGALMKTAWIMKPSHSISHGNLDQLNQNNNSAVSKLNRTMSAPIMNAFDLISLSTGLDLSGLFDGRKKTEKRFSALTAARNILETVGAIGEELGFRAEQQKSESGTIGLQKGEVVVLVKIFNLAPSLFLVEVKMMSSNEEEFKLYWEEIRTRLQDDISIWHDGGSETGEK